MRWNPKNPGEHQYATDIKWAESNASIIADFYKNMKTEVNTLNYMYTKMIKNIKIDLKSIAILRIFSIAMLFVSSAKVYRGFNLSYFALFLLDNHVNRNKYFC